MKTKVTPLLVSALLLRAISSSGVTLLSDPVFVPATNAPLAGVLRLTTDVNSRVSVSVSDGASTWTRTFHDFSLTHSVTLAGFKPNRTNHLVVTVYDQAQNAQSPPQPLIFVTPSLPADFPHWTVLHSEPDKMEPGYTLFIVQNRTAKAAYVTIVNNSGEVVWYRPAPAVADVDVRQMVNGDFFIEEQTANRFLELNLLGETVNTWSAPPQYPVNNHEGVVTDHGTILYLSDVSRIISNFPSSTTNTQAELVTAKVDDNPVVEISAKDGTLLNAWSPLDMLDPTRVTYLTYTFQTSFGVDNEHANAALEDNSDNSIIVSLRTQNAVFKFLRSTGQLKWILGSHANWSAKCQPYLLNPVGTNFAWSYGQHAPEITPQRTLLLYDDGNYRADLFAPPILDWNNYSRAVEYKINESTMEVSQVWDTSQAAGDRLYTFAVGDADWLAQSGNVLVTYGLVSYVNGVHPSATATNATMARIIEYTHEPVAKPVFDLAFFDYNNTSPSYMGCLCYRSYRIPDLYPHPAMPIADLSVTMSAAGPWLQFSADPTRTYTVEAATDAQNWQPIGTPTPGPQTDSFVFLDSSGTSAMRFYRVVSY
jgi:hypothetical protein